MAKRPTRLRFTEDDLSSDAVKKAAGKAEKAAAKAEKAVDKITPKKHRKLRQEADVSASRTAKLRFGKAKADDIPPKPSGIKRTVTHAPVDTLSANVDMKMIMWAFRQPIRQSLVRKLLTILPIMRFTVIS
jgi:hypothetical protein